MGLGNENVNVNVNVNVVNSVAQKRNSESSKSSVHVVASSIDTNDNGQQQHQQEQEQQQQPMIYVLNRIVVDTMYKLLCHSYPTTTTPTTTVRSRKTSPQFPAAFHPATAVKAETQTSSSSSSSPLLRTLHFERFYILLATILRVPYFAYLSVMHLQETFGQRYTTPTTPATTTTTSTTTQVLSDDITTTTDNTNNTDNDIVDNTNSHNHLHTYYDVIRDEERIQTMRLHYAQADNELHHLLIIESLLPRRNSESESEIESGSDSDDNYNSSRGDNTKTMSMPSISWVDRFVANSISCFYFGYIVMIYGLCGQQHVAYQLHELVQESAYQTYHSFLLDYEEELKQDDYCPLDLDLDLDVPEWEEECTSTPAIAHHYYEIECQESSTCQGKKKENNTTNDTNDNNPYLFDLLSSYPASVSTSSSSSSSLSSSCQSNTSTSTTTTTMHNTNTNNNNNNSEQHKQEQEQTQHVPQQQQQQEQQRQRRRQLQVPLTNLYDVFVNIRDDEQEHYHTLRHLRQRNNKNKQSLNQ